MNARRITLRRWLAFACACLTGGAMAAGQSSTSYRIAADTLNSGVADMASTSYQLSSSLGDLTGGGTLASASYRISPGFRNEAQLLGATVPGAPTGVTATPGNAQATVSFGAPASNGGFPVTSFTVSCGAVQVSGGASPILVTGLANGTLYSCTVRATNAIGTGSASAAASVTPVLSVAPAITSASSVSLTVGTAGTFTVTATGAPAPTLSVSGALPAGVTFTPATGVLAGSPALGSVGTYPLTFNAINGVVPNASQSFTLTVAKVNQTISFTNPGAQTLSGTPLALTATASSHLTVTFSSATTGVCTVSGASVTMLTGGTCTLHADQAGDANYSAAPQVTQSFTVTGLFRAYLSKSGDDANPCTLSHPCRLLPAALAVVNVGGEIWMLDSANFNASTVSVTKSVTILAVPGALGSVVANNSDAILVTGSASIEVTLRNLVILNLSGAGNTGIQFSMGSQVTVEGCEIYGMGTGIDTPAPGGLLTIKDTTIRDIAGVGIQLQSSMMAVLSQVALLNNGTAGIRVNGGAQAMVSESSISGSTTGASVSSIGGTARITLSATQLSGNGTALAVSATTGATAQAILEDVTISHNTTGVALSGVGTTAVFSRQDNLLKFNGTDVTGGALTPQAAF